MCLMDAKQARPTVMKDPHDMSGHTVATSNCDDDFHFTKETFPASWLLRKDSIAVQQDRHSTNDCEKHEKNPHLEDFLIPHHVVHLKRLDEDDDEAYFEFRITQDDITGDVSLLVTDFATEDEIEDSKVLWDKQIDQLMSLLGSGSR